jgi:hypothetical protein
MDLVSVLWKTGMCSFVRKVAHHFPSHSFDAVGATTINLYTMWTLFLKKRSVKFNPKDPSTWRSGAGKAAMNAVEANDVEELKVCVLCFSRLYTGL